jgi:2-dehydro-3-deoxyphosphooctonate aldolase (KDO 8-P synthase)
MQRQSFKLAPGVEIGGSGDPVLIAGPCVIESTEMALGVARSLASLAERHGVRVVFKASFDKANRSSVESFRGPGLDEGLRALELVRRETGLAVLTDVHEPHQAEAVAEVVDVLQVPAFLCRQTDLLQACGRAAEAGRAVNIKKGQFMAPEDMRNAVEKVQVTGNQCVSVTERGASFGYHNLVVDMRSFAIIRSFAPVIFDVTHSLQLPGGLGHATGGAREHALDLARAAAGAGVDGFFVEVHPDPPRALSDATTQLRPDELELLVRQTLAISRAAREIGA